MNNNMEYYLPNIIIYHLHNKRCNNKREIDVTIDPKIWNILGL